MLCPTLLSFRRLTAPICLRPKANGPTESLDQSPMRVGCARLPSHFRVLHGQKMGGVHYFPPNLPFELPDRKVLLLSSVIIRINDLPNNRVRLTCLYYKFPISSSDFTTASSGNQMLNEKQLAQAESGRNAVILVKTEKEKCFKKYVVHNCYLPLPLSLFMSAHRSWVMLIPSSSLENP